MQSVNHFIYLFSRNEKKKYLVEEKKINKSNGSIVYYIYIHFYCSPISSTNFLIHYLYFIFNIVFCCCCFISWLFIYLFFQKKSAFFWIYLIVSTISKIHRKKGRARKQNERMSEWKKKQMDQIRWRKYFMYLDEWFQHLRRNININS